MKPLDIARGLYAHSPKFVRSAAGPLLARVPTGLKFGSTYKAWRARIARAENDPQYAAAQHLVALRALLEKAHRGSPFYRALLDTAFGSGFDAAGFTPAELPRLPVLDKAQLSAAGEAALAVPHWQVEAATTSGSNAEAPFGFYLDRDRSPREMAFVYDGWARIGFREHDARVALRGLNLDESGAHYWDPALRELKIAVFPLTTADAAAFIDQIDRRGIRFLYGYPSAIELLCRRMRELGRVPRAGIAGILPISEPLYPHQRALMRSVLGAVRFSVFYGLSEKTAFALEDSEEEGFYTFNPLYGATELVDEAGVPVTEPGGEGRIVATGFISTGMPFIRYDTGDFAQLVEPATAANGYRLRVRGLAPRRKPDFLISRDGRRVVATSLTPEDTAMFAGIAEVQFYQETPGEVTIRYLLAPQGSPADAERLRAHLEAETQGHIAFASEEVSQIASGRGGKRAFIDQRLDISRY